MSPGEQADRHDRNFIEAMTMLASSAVAGTTASYGAIPVAVTGIARAFFNGAWVLEQPQPDDLRRALDHLATAGVPFAVHVRADLNEVVRSAPQLGLHDEGRLPCFAMERGPIPPPLPGLVIVRADRSNWDSFLDVNAAGFEMPREIAASILPTHVLDDPRLRVYLGIADGRPVATSASVRTGDTIGIYSVTTVPHARGRGYGRAMTWHTLGDADPGWELAVLQASDMGRPIYERMGFRLVREFVELVGGPAG